MQRMSNAGNNCSYTGLYQLGGVPRGRVGSGEAFRGGWHLPAWSLSVPAMCHETLPAAGRVLQPCVSGKGRHPLRGASHGKSRDRWKMVFI